MSNEKLIELAAVKLCELHGVERPPKDVSWSRLRILQTMELKTFQAIAHAQEQLEVSQLAQVKDWIHKNQRDNTYVLSGELLGFIDELSDEEVTG